MNQQPSSPTPSLAISPVAASNISPVHSPIVSPVSNSDSLPEQVPVLPLPSQSNSSSTTEHTEIEEASTPQADPPAVTVATSEDQATKTSIWTRSTDLLLDTWALELAALVLSLSCLISIWVLLIIFHGKALQNWHSYFGINTILSVLATAMKGSLMLATTAALGQLKWTWSHQRYRTMHDFALLDDASRGLFGAIQLVFHLHFWHLASLGCLVTVLSVTTSAFVQASVNTFTGSVEEHGAASVPVCFGNHSVKQGISQWESDDWYSNDYEISFGNALYVGAVAEDASSVANLAPARCPTRKCSSEVQSSLGMCCHCTSRTADLVIKHWRSGSNRTIHASLPGVVDGPTLAIQVEITPQLLAAVTYPYINISMPIYSTTAELTTDIFTSYPRRMTPMTLTILRSAPGSQTDFIPTNESDYSWYTPFDAYQCNFSLCAKAFSVDVHDGVLNEVPVAQVLTGHWQHLYEHQGTFEFDPITNAGPSRIFTDNEGELWMYDFLSASSLIGSGQQLWGQENLSNGMTNWQGDLEYTSPLLQVLAECGDKIPTTMDRIANALTNTMRANCNQPAYGAATTTVAFIHSRLWAMSVPTLMVVLGNVFVLLTMWRNYRCGLPLWKSSVLASVLHTRAEEERGGADGLLGPSTSTSTSIYRVGTNEGLKISTLSRRAKHIVSMSDDALEKG